ncbi:uncharacterized protein LOC125601124 [Brassica napus]|uniref:uncharacterized protein LOC125601124 n=1 Tax=Brassica napus TaxID=3708 RepID=UPI00207899E2|nr:uncharacterized protein LOC125601124 [Brassica napus]
MLKDIERALDSFRDQLNTAEDDFDMWRRSSGYKPKFLIQETLLLLWPKGIWFSQATQSLLSWLGLQLGEDYLPWIGFLNGVKALTQVVSYAKHSRIPEPSFFECSFSAQVWEHLVKGILQNSYTAEWTGIKILLVDRNLERYKLLCTRYAFQALSMRYGENAIGACMENHRCPLKL